MYVPEPVIRMAIAPMSRDGADRLGKALQRFRREDPTFQVTTDQETGETLIAGMGELHLEVYVERIRREYGVEVEVGRPKVNYREAPTQRAEFNTRHRKQTGGSGQYAHIIGSLDVLPEGAEETFIFQESVVGGRIPKEYIPAVEKGFRRAIVKGPVAGFPVVGLHVKLEDGSFHEVDSSELAFQTCAVTAMRETFAKTKAGTVGAGDEDRDRVPGAIPRLGGGQPHLARGLVMATETIGPITRIDGEVPLAETFGYSTDLRSLTQGQGTFSMEFARYKRLPASLAEESDRRSEEGVEGGVGGGVRDCAPSWVASATWLAPMIFRGKA